MRRAQALSTARVSGLDLTGEVLPRLGHDLISQRDWMEMIYRDRSPDSHIRSAFRNATEGSIPTTCTARRHSGGRANSKSPTPCGPGRRPHPGPVRSPDQLMVLIHGSNRVHAFVDGY